MELSDVAAGAEMRAFALHLALPSLASIAAPKLVADIHIASYGAETNGTSMIMPSYAGTTLAGVSARTVS